MKDPPHNRECSLDSSKDHVEKDSETPQLQMLSSLSDGTCKSEGESLVQKGIFYDTGYQFICIISNIQCTV